MTEAVVKQTKPAAHWEIKLLHAPGVFFSPTRNQVDDARQKRHVASWAARL
mgnify:CR=1 FL=1